MPQARNGYVSPPGIPRATERSRSLFTYSNVSKVGQTIAFCRLSFSPPFPASGPPRKSPWKVPLDLVRHVSDRVVGAVGRRKGAGGLGRKLEPLAVVGGVGVVDEVRGRVGFGGPEHRVVNLPD